jgi:hypothetical protein
VKIASPPKSSPARTRASEPKVLADARRSLSALATTAVAKTIVAQSAKPKVPVTGQHPLLQDFGQALGMGLGVVVTEALRLVPSWNTPVLGANGKPAQDVPGATRIGNNDILKRHEEVVGPQVSALVAKLPPGAVHDLLAGFASGATAAPGASYRIDSALADAFED